MFKTISTALLAVSVLAAPALAATSGKTDAAPVTKQAPVKTSKAVGAKTAVKPSVRNANARMGNHHASHHQAHRHHRSHKMAAHKSHTRVSFRQVKPVGKRG